MPYYSIYKDIIFIEGDEPSAILVAKIEYNKKNTFSQQLKGIDIVKDNLAEQTKKLNANAIINFKYGQKTLSFFRSLLFTLDDNIQWYGNGIAARISDQRYNAIKNGIK